MQRFSWIATPAWIVALAFLLVACPAQNTHKPGATSIDETSQPLPRVDVTRARDLIQARPDLLLLDVRTPQEYSAGHLPGARNLPVQELESRLHEIEKNQPILVYCRTQNRSGRAQQLLADRGYQVTLMQGGWSAWSAAGLPSEK